MRSFARGNVFITVGLAEKLNIVQPTDVRELMRSQAGENTADIRTYPSLIVRVASPNNVQAVEDAVKKLGFSTFSLLDATRSLRRFFAILDLFLGIFGSLALAVASLGIINTLVMAILERRREIGIMKALGASDGDVRLLFFAEAGAMGALGGAAGVLLGWAIGRAINFAANIYLERQQLPPEHIWSVPWWLVGGAIGFSLVISLVSGLYPAARASRLDPVQALRYE
jgi:putative ABC transport system permease protein